MEKVEMPKRVNTRQHFTGLPEGTVIFLFTDIEGSTKLLKQLGADRYGEVLADQQRILQSAVASLDARSLSGRIKFELTRCST
jgi:class 3 adenylate cyclase